MSKIRDYEIERVEWSPDDHGGGFPAVDVRATIYDEKELDNLIIKLMRERTWLMRQNLKVKGLVIKPRTQPPAQKKVSR